MKKIALSVLALGVISALLLAGCGTTSSTTAAAAKDPDTITIAWLPNNAGEDFKDTRAAIDKVIADATGKKVEDKLTTDYAIVIEAVSKGDAQLAFVGAQQYVEAHNKNPKVLPLVVNSGNSGTLKDALYYSRFAVKKGNESQYQSGSGFSIDNIAGKRMGFVSPSSTSGFAVPTSQILSTFTKQDKWKNLTKDDLTQGGNGKFFSQVTFGGSHQGNAVNLLTDKVDVAAIDDVDLVSYVDLTSGKENTEGAVYTVKNNATAPFDKLAGAQFTLIKPIPVMNGPIMVNTGALTQQTVEKLTAALTSDTTTQDPKIFIPKDSKTKGFFNQPQHFLKVDDSWYQPIRDLK